MSVKGLVFVIKLLLSVPQIYSKIDPLIRLLLKSISLLLL